MSDYHIQDTSSITDETLEEMHSNCQNCQTFFRLKYGLISVLFIPGDGSVMDPQMDMNHQHMDPHLQQVRASLLTKSMRVLSVADTPRPPSPAWSWSSL